MRLVKLRTATSIGFANEGPELDVWINPAHVVKVMQQEAGTKRRVILYHDNPARDRFVEYTVVMGEARDVAIALDVGLADD